MPTLHCHSLRHACYCITVVASVVGPRKTMKIWKDLSPHITTKSTNITSCSTNTQSSSVDFTKPLTWVSDATTTITIAPVNRKKHTKPRYRTPQNNAEGLTQITILRNIISRKHWTDTLKKRFVSHKIAQIWSTRFDLFKRGILVSTMDWFIHDFSFLLLKF